MNKKIIAILTLLLVMISMSAVSAFDFGSLFGSNEKTKVNIGGIDFNIPSGFKEDSSNASKEISSSIQKQGLNTTVKAYTKDSNSLGFFVSNLTAQGFNTTDVLNNGNQTTINNVAGYISESDGIYVFSYIKDGCWVIVSSTDKNLYKDCIIA